jgi:hypothetical protein
MRSWKKPTPEQVTKTLAVLARPEHRRYFFDRLDNPEWISALRERGFFSAPPPPIRNPEDGSVRFPPWPESRLLARVARSAPDLVARVILAIPATDNVAVHEDIVEAALTVPPATARDIAVREAAWIQGTSQQTIFLLPDKLGALISHLAKGNECNSALQLARVLLAVLPDPKPGVLREPQGRMDEHDYQQILERNVPDLVTVVPLASLRLLCDLLREAVEMPLRDKEPERASDISTAWRHAVEESTQDLSPTLIQGVRGLLVSALRDATEQVVRDQLLPMADVVGVLGGYRWLIFRRIVLHVLRLFPDAAQGLITQRLLDVDLLANPHEISLLHEYAVLLREQFKRLSEEDQATIFEWIDRGPDLARVKERYETNIGPFADDRAERYRKYWQQNRLALICDELPAPWLARYQELVRELGEPEHPEFQSYSSGVESGPTSPITAQELRSLSVEEVVTRIARFHAEWAPSPSISSPTPEGLGRELSAAVAQSPQQFAADAARFKALHPTYVRALIYGLDQAGRQKRRFDWAPVLEVCRWIVAQPREVLGQQPERNWAVFDLDRNWIPGRSAVAHLLSTAFEGDESGLPFELRQAAWCVLEPLTSDPAPDQEYESRYLSSAGPAHISLNTIRGEALHAVVRYALWVQRHLKTLQNPEAVVAQGFGTMPEVRRVLDTHLNTTTDPSVAIRSVYGRWYPWLHLLDAHWAVSKLPDMFPADESLHRYRAAAWSAYVILCPAYDSIFEVLQEEYARAVELIGTDDANLERMDRADERLAEHLALMYGRGKIPLEVPGSLLSRFFEKADDALRAHALETAGRILGQEQERLPSEVIERLKRLWEGRFKAAQPSPAAHRAELGAFTWWFLSGKFDQAWSLDQLRQVLRLIGSVEPGFMVAQRLKEAAPSYPGLTVECLSLMIEGDREGWHFYQWREEARETLQAAKQTGDAAVLEAVDDVVNRLGARGFFDFRDLLS